MIVHSLKIASNLIAITLFLSLFSNHSVHAGEDTFFEHLSVSQGLSHSGVYCFLQDSKGFMWIGTEDGLNRYDGTDFKIFRHDPENEKSISHNEVWSIQEDSQGNLWIGTWGGGLNRFNWDTETFTRYMHNEEDTTSISHNLVGIVQIDKNDTVWASTFGGGLNRFDIKKHTFTRYTHDKNNPNSLSSNTLWPVYVDRKGIVWIGTIGAGLDRFDPQTETFVHYRHDTNSSQSLDSDEIWSIYEDRHGVLWVGTDRGLNAFDPETETFTHYQHNEEDDTSISKSNIWSIVEDKEGNFWVGSWGDGLNRFDRETETFIHYRQNKNIAHSLSSDVVSMLYEDRTGGLWIGTYQNGINQVLPYFKKFNHYQVVTEHSTCPKSMMVSTFYEDKAGDVWIGTDQGLSLFHTETKTFLHGHNIYGLNALSGKNITEIFEDTKGDIWIGTYLDGLSRYDLKTGTVVTYPIDKTGKNPNALNSQTVMAIEQGQDGNIWLGTIIGGLNEFNPHTGIFTRYMHDDNNPKSLSHNFIYDIYEDAAGLLWIGTSGGGLNTFDPETHKVVQFLHDSNNPKSISNNNVNTIFQDHAGVLWVGTASGLNKFHAETKIFTRYYQQDGLPDSAINGILEDDQQCLWISTNQGLTKFNPEKETFKNYYVDDGLQSSEFNIGAALKARSGLLFFGGPNGFNAFYPGDIIDNPHKPNVVITNFKIFNKSVPIAPDSPLKKTISETKELLLSYKDSMFTFEFVALNFLNPKRDQYAYRMDGFDKDWNFVDTSRRFATYTNLDPGTYTFRVKASNSDSVWNESGTSLKITISPPWWERWWFRLLVALFVCGSVYGVFSWRVRTMKAQRKRLKILVAKKTKELEKKSKKLEELATHDTLTRLYNRTKLDEVFRTELLRSARSNSQFGLILLDIDYFKSVNDNYGHQVGDQILQEFADRLRRNVRQTDTIGRWGGEEFLILCPDTGVNGIQALAEKLRIAIGHNTFSVVGKKTASFGVTVYEKGDTIESMVAKADAALYRAKSSGRNRVELQTQVVSPQHLSS
ncbi:ligand-binding sensor domain-containing protein [Desulfovibrio inopinatus]|uniref:ligand-binding sensor domain-containing protein n=1 Tax=Desulfovibrio inopinatus TaxID=102109 RepID=UPI0024809F07|nr:ligand-binding sensor domain-containing diguanylate cyclase [Desulfovibrio inopinatus]